jgi:ferredoxin
LATHRQATDTYISGELDESLRDDVEEAAEVCPLQASTVD